MITIRPVRQTVGLTIELGPDDVDHIVWTGEHLGEIIRLLEGKKTTLAALRRVLNTPEAQRDIEAFYKFTASASDCLSRAQTQDMKTGGRA